MAHKIGLVLDGGGGKGAYQIGVWKALIDSGLINYVTDVAGTSVGGLNATLFVKGDHELAEKIWSEEISQITPTRIAMGVKALIDKYLSDMSFFDEKKMNCFITTCNISPGAANKVESIEYAGKNIKKCKCGSAEYFNLKYYSEDERKKYINDYSINSTILLATSAIPVFCKAMKIDGKYHVDGGVVDNSPAKAIYLGTHCDYIIVIHLSQDKDKDFDEIKKSAPVLEIIPSKDIGGFIDGTINFKAKHAKELMLCGYFDSLELFKTIKRNWDKEEAAKQAASLSYSKRIIKSLSPEEKYRLYNECRFLTGNNRAKLNYITDSGFGKMVRHVISGKNNKAKNKILENTVELQDKMNRILECLDDETLELKLDMRYVFDELQKQADVQLKTSSSVLRLSNIVGNNTNQIAYISEFLSENFSEFKAFDTKQSKDDLGELEVIKNTMINCIDVINKQNEELWRQQNARLAAEKTVIEEAGKYRFLRISPFEACAVTINGILPSAVEGDKDPRENKVELKTVLKYLDQYECSIVIQPEGWEEPPSSKAKVIHPADYYMYLWFINTPQEERAGQRVCMMDYHYGKIYAYGFQVNEKGESYYYDLSFTMDWKQSKYGLGKDLENNFGKNFGNVICYRTFTITYQPLENKLNNTKYYKINMINPNWEQILFSDDGEQFKLLVEKFAGKNALPQVIVV